MAFSLDIRCHSEIGLVRRNNQDSGYVSPRMLVVADGMGGHNAGEVASAIAVEEFEKLTIQENVTVDQLGQALRTAADPNGKGTESWRPNSIRS